MKMEFVNIGGGKVVHTTAKAALFRLADETEHWVPLGSLSTRTAAQAIKGANLERIYVESWVADVNALGVVK